MEDTRTEDELLGTIMQWLSKYAERSEGGESTQLEIGIWDYIIKPHTYYAVVADTSRREPVVYGKTSCGTASVRQALQALVDEILVGEIAEMTKAEAVKVRAEIISNTDGEFTYEEVDELGRMWRRTVGQYGDEK